VTGLNQGERYMGPSHAPFAGHLLHPLPGHGFAQLSKLLHHLAGSAEAGLAQAGELCLEVRLFPVDEVAQDVHLVAGDIGAHLDAGDQGEVRMAGGGSKRLGQTVGGVVVGKG